MARKNVSISGTAALMHNESRGKHVLFKDKSGKDSESYEMDSLEQTTSTKNRKNRTFGEAEEDEEEEAVVHHIIKGHDTLAGIAIQYRTPVEVLKRLNNLWQDADLHSLKTIKIPAPKHGVLYNDVHTNNGKEFFEDNSVEHTGRRPVASKNGEEAIDMAENEDGSPLKRDAVGSQSADYLAKLDKTVASAIAQQEELLDNDNEPLISSPYLVIRRSSTDMLNKEWRYVALALAVGGIISPFLLYAFGYFQKQER